MDIDVVLNNIDAPPSFSQRLKSENHCSLELVGGPKSQRDAIGAKSSSRGRRSTARDVFSGGSYASTSDRVSISPRRATKIEKLEIRWPGCVEEISVPQSTASSRRSKARESKPINRTLKFGTVANPSAASR